MEININIAGEELDMKTAAKQLHRIADMVRAGVTDMNGFNIEYLGAFMVAVDFESDGPTAHHHDYLDGEGNHVHVNAEGTVVFRRIVNEGGKDEIEQLFEHGIKLDDWGKDHGGITPYFEPGHEPGGHEGHNHG